MKTYLKAMRIDKHVPINLMSDGDSQSYPNTFLQYEKLIGLVGIILENNNNNKINKQT